MFSTSFQAFKYTQLPLTTPSSKDISQEVSPIHLKGVANKISSKLLLKPCFRCVVNVATVSTYGPYTSRSVVHYFSYVTLKFYNGTQF